jgi:hypothetical protein
MNLNKVIIVGLVRCTIPQLYVTRDKDGNLEVYHNDCYLTDFLKIFCPDALAEIATIYEQELQEFAGIQGIE